MDADKNADANINPVAYIIQTQLTAKIDAELKRQQLGTSFDYFKRKLSAKSKKSLRHKKFLKERINLGSEDEDAQFDTNSVRYLKTRARADRKQFKQKHHNKRSA